MGAWSIICQIFCWYLVNQDSGVENPEIDITTLEEQPASPHVAAEKKGETLQQDDVDGDGKYTAYLILSGKERRKLVRELEKEGVLWQAQAERRWLAGLLANEKAVAPLLRFLKATDVGGSEGARERELEWGQKNDQAGGDLLGWTQEGIAQKSYLLTAAR